jgi:hypothetical protein
LNEFDRKAREWDDSPMRVERAGFIRRAPSMAYAIQREPGRAPRNPVFLAVGKQD